MIPPNAPDQRPSLLDEKGLPCSPETERFVLGSVLLGGNDVFEAITLDPADFSLEKHRRIFARMKDIADRGVKIDRVTLANELMTAGQIESVDGFSYLVSLDQDLPVIANLDAYCNIVAEKSRLRQIIFTAQKTIDRALIQDASSAELAAYTTEKLSDIAALMDTGSIGWTPTEIIESFPGGVSAFLDPTLRPRGLQTGFNRLDDMTGGFMAGQLIILAARPSQGKTALLLNIASFLTLDPKQRRPVGIFSLEMAKSVLLTRMLCANARVDSHKFRMGYLNADERRKLQVWLAAIQDAHLFINDESLTSQELIRKIRWLVKEHGVQIVGIDYLGLIVSEGRSENKNQEISQLTRSLKLLSKELSIPIVLLCQLSRANEKRSDPRPQLSDLRDSGSIEQDADLVAFIFREEVYKKDREDLRGIAELIVSKQREGPTGVVPLRFMGPFVKFENRSDDLSEPE